MRFTWKVRKQFPTIHRPLKEPWLNDTKCNNSKNCAANVIQTPKLGNEVDRNEEHMQSLDVGVSSRLTSRNFTERPLRRRLRGIAKPRQFHIISSHSPSRDAQDPVNPLLTHDRDPNQLSLYHPHLKYNPEDDRRYSRDAGG